MVRTYKRRTLPSRLLMALLYSSEGIKSRWEATDGYRVEVDIGPLARSIRASNSRLREAIKVLAILGVIAPVETPKRGRVTILVLAPTKILNK